MQDEDFGLITFKPHKAISADYFVGCVYFSPLQQDVDFLIYAPKSGITAAQKSLYKEIETDYSAAISQSIPLIEAALHKNGFPVKIADFNREFEPYRLILPELQNHVAPVWTMEYKTVHDPGNHYCVACSRQQPVRVTTTPAQD